MKQMLRCVMLLLILCAGTASAAMYLDPHGQGQVLFYPYYTVNAGQSSLISVVNTSARGKFVAIFFREGARGDFTLDFTLYLAPHDTWTAAVFAQDSQGAANLLTTDTTCTNPDVHDASLPRLADGRPYVPFLAGDFQPIPPLPGQALRSREGYVQMIEVGELDVTASGWASERRCAELRAAVGIVPPVPALSTPGGGLYGGLAIVNVAAGTYFATQATAIGGFADHVLLKNTNDSPFTDLNLGVHDAQVNLGNRLVTATYASAIDAVSALLMSESLWGDFVTESAAGATTEWVLTQPTKAYYIDGSPVHLPYASVTRPSPIMACQPYAAEIYDREQRVISALNGVDPPPAAAWSLCYSTDVLRFGSTTGTSVLGSRLSGYVGNFNPPATSGSMKLKPGVGTQATTASSLPASSGPTLAGLPVIGFQLVNYLNANVVPGVLANYAAAEPLRPTVACKDAAGAVVACP